MHRRTFMLLASLAIAAVAMPAAAATIHDAAEKGDLEEVKRQITAGADIESRDALGNTALHASAYNGQLPLVQWLLSQKANVKARNNLGATPLHVAAYAGRKDVVALLLANGADVDARRAGDGRTPLFDAAVNGHSEALELLISHGADVNAKGSNDDTPLHWAVLEDHGAAAKILMTRGAELNAEDADGQAPLDLALNKGHQRMATWLTAEGGRRGRLTTRDRLAGTLLAVLTFASLAAYVLGLAIVLNARDIRNFRAGRHPRAVLVGRVIGVMAAVAAWEYVTSRFGSLGSEVRPGLTAVEQGQLHGERYAELMTHLLFTIPGAYLIAASITRIGTERLLFGSSQQTSDTERYDEPSEVTHEPADELGPSVSPTEQLWRRKSDEEIEGAVRRLSDYTEETQKILQAEARRRRIGFSG